MQYGNTIQWVFGQGELDQEHHTFLWMDGEVFYQALQGGEQTKPFGVQGVFGRELQAADCKLTVAGNQQVSGVYQAGEAKGEVCESSTEELFGECD